MLARSIDKTFAIVFLGFSFFVATGCGEKKAPNDGFHNVTSNSNSGQATQDSIKAPSRKPDFTMTIDDLAAECASEEDAKKAEKKYEAIGIVRIAGKSAKILEITGTISRVGTNIIGEPYVIMEPTKGPKFYIQAFLMPEDFTRGMYLSSNQKVKITGEMQSAEKGKVMFVSRDLEEVSKSTVIVISAPDLVKEFNKDKQAWEQKYKDHTDLIVFGEIEEMTKERGFEFAKLKGDGKMRVSFTIDGKGLQKGQTVLLRGGFPPRLSDNEIHIDGGLKVGKK